MTSVFIAIFITFLLALAVKQLSHALVQGSLFEPLRKYLRARMRERVFGFETLSELFSCKLCMTMQVSLWSVLIPAAIAGHMGGAARMLLSDTASTFMVSMYLVLGSFMYAMAVSGIALGLWILLEYPAQRYEETALALQEARETIADLEAQLSIDTTTES